jgi:hypothetical protein
LHHETRSCASSVSVVEEPRFDPPVLLEREPDARWPVVPPVAPGGSRIARRTFQMPRQEDSRMSRPSKYTLRFAGFVLVFAIVAVALSSGPTVSTPYISALSPLVIQPAYAAKCANQTCQVSPRGGYVCVSNNRTSCNPDHHTGTCVITNC